jgi:VWFA-related protein
MLMRARVGSLLFAALLCAAGALAQQNNAQAKPDSGKIHLDVVVTSKSGPHVDGLQQSDFTLLDNKVPQTITSFKAVTGREASIEAILVIDAVNVDYQDLSYARQQVENFVRAEGGRLTYPVAVAVFTDQSVQLVTDFSKDGKALGAAVESANIGKRDINRSTQYGASERLQLSLEALSRLANSEAPRPGRKVIIWVSPGWPLLSGPRIELSGKDVQGIFASVVYLSTLLREARVTLYSVNPMGSGVSNSWFYDQFVKGVSKPGQVDAADLGLPVLALQSGGLALDYSNDIPGLLRKCLADAAPYYEISFDSPPAKQPDTYHHIDIKLTQPGLKARTREGYYAQPAPRN